LYSYGIVTEFVPNGSLKHFLEKNKSVLKLWQLVSFAKVPDVETQTQTDSEYLSFDSYSPLGNRCWYVAPVLTQTSVAPS
jgi:hypothetical protein